MVVEMGVAKVDSTAVELDQKWAVQLDGEWVDKLEADSAALSVVPMEVGMVDDLVCGTAETRVYKMAVVWAVWKVELLD